MGHTPLLFSLAFFIVCTISGILGAYIIYINPKNSINRIFFTLTMSLFLWSFGFSLAISAKNMEACLFWRRFSGLGWGSFFSFLLHFFLIFTGKKDILKKWYSYVLMYLPALVTIYVFVISDSLSRKQYNLVYTSNGWTNIQVRNKWDWFYYIYYISFSVVGLLLAINCKKASLSQKKKQQVKIILISFLTALFLGTITDLLLNSWYSLNTPQMAPIIMLLPITCVYYSIRKYGFMKPRTVNNNNEIILNEASRIRIYNYMSISFLAGGFLNFFSLYLLFENADLFSVLFFSIAVSLIGVIIQVIQRLKLSSDLKDIICTVTISLVIPIITLRFIEYASITVWAFPFLFIITSLVFNKRVILISISASIIITQIIVWIVTPRVMVRVDEVDHIVRIGLFIIGMCLSFYVNEVYVLRLKENAEQVGFQKLISEISSDFVNVNQINLNEKINIMLEKSTEFFQTDRAHIYLSKLKNNIMTFSYECSNNGINAQAKNYSKNLEQGLPSWFNDLLSNRVVEIEDIEKLPKDEIKKIPKYDKDNTRSLLAIPIASKDLVLGFLEFDSVKIKKKWRQDHIGLLKILSNILADAIAKVQAEKEINYRAYYDSLTKLPNRYLFNDRLNQAINLAARLEKKLGIIFIDLDSFKTVNDILGHEGGDRLLKDIADQLSFCVRKSDTVSRFGGDEFLIMLNNISDTASINKIVGKILNLFEKPFILNDQEFFLTVSVGISVYPDDGENSEVLIKNADIAMYNAKDKGKNQIVWCSTEMKEEIQTRMKLTNSLYRALERNELLIYYQPQINLKTKEICGVEALIRWKHPEMGMISPGVFIPLAEQTGLINSIGEWVLRSACKQNKLWQDMGLPPLRMAVNLSVKQLKNPNIILLVDKVIKENGLNPEYLELEITESVIIEETNQILNILSGLKKLGVSISIDDFGTEYSSLNRLRLLPADRIKIDMQFIRGIEENEKDKAILEVIIQLAKNLGLKVIAEGVEKKAQLDYLESWKCDEIQGYYYYKPMPADELETILKNYNEK